MNKVSSVNKVQQTIPEPNPDKKQPEIHQSVKFDQPNCQQQKDENLNLSEQHLELKKLKTSSCNKENGPTQGILKMKSQKNMLIDNKKQEKQTQYPFNQLKSNSVMFNNCNKQYQTAQAIRETSKMKRPETSKQNCNRSQSKTHLTNDIKAQVIPQAQNKTNGALTQRENQKHENVYISKRINSLSNKGEEYKRMIKSKSRASSKKKSDKKVEKQNDGNYNTMNFSNSNRSINVNSIQIRNLAAPAQVKGMSRFFNNFNNNFASIKQNVKRQGSQSSMVAKQVQAKAVLELDQNNKQIAKSKINENKQKLQPKPIVFIDLFGEESNQQDLNPAAHQPKDSLHPNNNNELLNFKQNQKRSCSPQGSETDKITQRNSCNIKESQIPMERQNSFYLAKNQNEVPENQNEKVNIWIFKPDAQWQDQSKSSCVVESSLEEKSLLEIQKQKSMPFHNMASQQNDLLKLALLSQIVEGDKNGQSNANKVLIDNYSRQETLALCLNMLKSEQSIQQNYYNQFEDSNSDERNLIPSEINTQNNKNSYFQQRKESSLKRQLQNNCQNQENESPSLISDEQVADNQKLSNISNLEKQTHQSFGNQNLKSSLNGQGHNLKNYLCDSYEDEEVETELPQIPNEKRTLKNIMSNSSNEITQFYHKDYLLTKEKASNIGSQIQQSNIVQKSQVPFQQQSNQESDFKLGVFDFDKVLKNELKETTSNQNSQVHKIEQLRGSEILEIEQPQIKYIQQTNEQPDDCQGTEKDFSEDCQNRSIMENTCNIPDMKSPEFGCQINSKDNQIKEDNIKINNQFVLNAQDHQINFQSIYDQKLILNKLKDLLEIRPTVIQQYSNLKKSFSSQVNSNLSFTDQIPATQAIEGLSHEDRIKIQQFCQDWWDQTQEDKSIFNMALQYQQDVQESYFRSSIHNQQLNNEEMDFYNKQNYDRSQCMRKCIVLQSVVIGMTAFFSMLQRKNAIDVINCKVSSFHTNDSTVKQDLELRSRIGQLIKISFDQFMLCQSYLLGKLSSFEACVQDVRTAEHKLYNSYSEHIHLLFINKKIQSEIDYHIFNTKNQFSQYSLTAYIVNEENRDYQITQLSKRLQENISKVLEQEIQIQNSIGNQGNAELLCVLRDISQHSAEIDFQEGKNHIFESISASEVMPTSSGSADEEQEVQVQNDSDQNLMIVESYQQTNRSSSKLLVIDMDQELKNESSNNSQVNLEKEAKSVDQQCEQNKKQVQPQNPYGANLIKTFNNDVNQIIHEESREESMSISMINASRMDELNQRSHSVNKSKLNARNKFCSPGTIPAVGLENPSSTTLFSKESRDLDFQKVPEIQETEESEIDPVSSLRQRI